MIIDRADSFTGISHLSASFSFAFLVLLKYAYGRVDSLKRCLVVSVMMTLEFDALQWMLFDRLREAVLLVLQCYRFVDRYIDTEADKESEGVVYCLYRAKPN